jgi:hypothetical protein
MPRRYRDRWNLALAVFLVAAIASACRPAGGLRFALSFPESLSKEPLDGRMLLLISSDEKKEPRFQITRYADTQVVFGIDVERLPPGEPALFDGNAYGYPLKSYEAKNAYYVDSQWKRTPRAGLRDHLGGLRNTLLEIHQMEHALGTKGRSGGLRDAYQAAWAPVGEDGYPKPVWDPLTGEIDHSVTDYMRENYDLRYILERDWKKIGPKLRGKIHLYTGDMDNWYLPNSVYLMEAFLESTRDPYYDGEVKYGDRFVHCWSGGETSFTRTTRNQEIAREMEAHLLKTAPPGADTRSWRY